MCGVTRQVGLADNLTSVIDVEGEVARYASKVTPGRSAYRAARPRREHRQSRNR